MAQKRTTHFEDFHPVLRNDHGTICTICNLSLKASVAVLFSWLVLPEIIEN
jgi:hypothetical protein